MTHAPQAIVTATQVVNTTLRRLTKTSDRGRWSACSNLSSDWDSRTRDLAAMIPPHSRVIEFGAGRMVLAQVLPEGCSYIPSDLVDRGNNTIVCDLNAPILPPFPRCDVAVFSGVLEYVHDIDRLVRHLSACVDMFIVSYAVFDTRWHRLRPLRRLLRLRHGWVNDYSLAELQNIFAAQGFICGREGRWQSQVLLCFSRESLA